MAKAQKKTGVAKKASKKKVSAVKGKTAKTARVVKAAPLKKSKAAPAKAAKKITKPAGPSKREKTALKAVTGTKTVSAAPKVKTQADLIAEAAIHGILEKKGKNVTCMNLQKVGNAVCDYFIICEAESTRQVAAIADSVDAEVKKATGENPYHTEGWANSLWVLIDYVNVVVHVFESETRHFYRLESLWADAEVKEYGVEYA